MLRKTLRLCSLLLLHHFSASAQQYCTPTPSKGGAFINQLRFANQGGITGGTDQNWNNNTDPAYLNRASTSIGTTQRGCLVNFGYSANNLSNPTGNNINVNMRIFADWNGDGDFDDASEIALDIDFPLPIYVGTGAAFVVPGFSVNNPRLRFAIRKGGQKATACGSYTGNVQDFTLTINTNVAPTLQTTVSPLLNDLIQNQTGNDGMSIRQFIHSQSPFSPLVTSPNTCGRIGIAVTGLTSSNGQWQYKIGSGAWTNMVGISTTNALLLDGGNESNDVSTRIRFVPTGAGTPTITCKGWDETFGQNGQYVNASIGGGSTAFTTATKTTSLTVLSTASAVSDVKVYMPQYSSPVNENNLYIASLAQATGSMKHAQNVPVNNNDGFGNDVVIDAANQKVIWSGGIAGDNILRSNLDGSGVEKIITTGYTAITGLAIGNGKLFFVNVAGDATKGIYTSNLNGTNAIRISSGTGQSDDYFDVPDIEFANNKLWYIDRSAEPLRIMSVNLDGTGTAAFYTSSDNTVTQYGLAVTPTDVYWTELNNTTNASSLKRKNIATGTVTTLCSESNMQYFDLVIDETNTLIYFVAADASNGSVPFTSGRIKTIPLIGGTPTQRLLLQSVPNSLAIGTPAPVLPVKVISVEASKLVQQIGINWKVAGEQDAAQYTIQKSTDGIHFHNIGTVAATGKSNYTWPDPVPEVGANYYRISINEKDGKTTLTNTVKVDWLKESKPVVSIYPTVLSASRQVQVAWQNVVPGSYTIKVLTATGQAISLSTVKVAGSSVQTFELPATLTAGAYWLQIGNGANLWNQKIVVP